jgi:hypothetical protein
MTPETATMMPFDFDKKDRAHDDTINPIHTPNTRNATSLYADDKAAIGKAVADETIEIEEIETNGARSTSGSDGSAKQHHVPGLNEEINVDDSKDHAIEEHLPETPLRKWSDAQQRYLDFLHTKNTGQRCTISLIQKALDVAWDMWDQRNHIDNNTVHGLTAAVIDIQVLLHRKDNDGFLSQDILLFSHPKTSCEKLQWISSLPRHLSRPAQVSRGIQQLLSTFTYDSSTPRDKKTINHPHDTHLYRHTMTQIRGHVHYTLQLVSTGKLTLLRSSKVHSFGPRLL